MPIIPTNNILTADGDYELQNSGGLWLWSPGEGQVAAVGDFGAGTLKLRGSTNGTDWADIGPHAIFTSAGSALFKWQWPYLQLSLAGSTAPNIIVGILPVTERSPQYV